MATGGLTPAGMISGKCIRTMTGTIAGDGASFAECAVAAGDSLQLRLCLEAQWVVVPMLPVVQAVAQAVATAFETCFEIFSTTNKIKPED